MGQPSFLKYLLRRNILAFMSLLCGMAIIASTVNYVSPANASTASVDSSVERDEDDLGHDGQDVPLGVDEPADGVAQQGVATAAATDCLGGPRKVHYTSDDVVHVEGCGQVFTLSQVFAELPAAVTGKYTDKRSLLELVDPTNKIWFLKVNMRVEEGARLNIVGGASGDANWLRLRSDDTGFAWLRSDNGNLLFQNTKVTSWDAARNSVDTDYSGDDTRTPEVEPGAGRAYIAARSVVTRDRQTAPPTACNVNGGTQEPYEARLDVINSEISYLGYYAAESYGIIWKVYYKPDSTDPTDQPPANRGLYAVVDVFGDVINSKLLHNYFGVYTFGGYCMRFTGSEYGHNVKYGLDPHDDSDYLLIDRNVFHNNGYHGVICSKFCNDLIITNNKSYNNRGGGGEDETNVPYTHGIMLHRSVTNTLVENNESYDNSGGGIAIFESYNNIIRNNKVTNNGQAALRLSVGSVNNLFEGNILVGPSATAAGSGYVVYTYKGSDLPIAGDGWVRNNVFRNNQMTAYKSPVVKMGEAAGNVFENNTISGPGVHFELRSAIDNSVHSNQLGSYVFSFDSTSRGIFRQTGLRGGTCYDVSASSTRVGRFAANSQGLIIFRYSGNGATTSFTITPAPNCTGAVGAPPQVFFPMLRQ